MTLRPRRRLAHDLRNWLDAFCQDLRYARRVVAHSRGFAIWVIGSLAIGMAVTIAALALLNAVLVLPFPEVADQKRPVRVSTGASESDQ